MIIKVENRNPKVRFLTSKGNRTPKEIWIDTVTGVKGMTKKDVVTHNTRLERLGITPDMTEEEAREQARKYLAAQ
ncbi:MAG: hypothetical protein GX957_16440 [Clostridiaceae bacterium]|nr:hypothetical protein [Clostridiaceae bacterium]